MPPAGVELAILASDWRQTLALDRSATGISKIGENNYCVTIFKHFFFCEALRTADTSKWVSPAQLLLWFKMGSTYSVFRALFLRSPSRWNRISGGSIGASPGGPGGPGGPAGPCSPFVPATPSDPFGPGGPSRPGNPGGPSLPFCPWGPVGPFNYSSKISHQEFDKNGLSSSARDFAETVSH